MVAVTTLTGRVDHGTRHTRQVRAGQTQRLRRAVAQHIHLHLVRHTRVPGREQLVLGELALVQRLQHVRRLHHDRVRVVYGAEEADGRQVAGTVLDGTAQRLLRRHATFGRDWRRAVGQRIQPRLLDQTLQELGRVVQIACLVRVR